MCKVILLLTIFINIDCRDLYLNTILESKDYNRYFLVSKIQIDSREKEMIVMNTNLYNYIKSRDKQYLNFIYYKDEIREKIKKQKPLFINSKGLKKMNAFYVKEDNSVKLIAEKGKDFFISYYFNVSKEKNYARIKQDIKSEKISQIIKILFDWNCLVGIVEGSITIIDINFCTRNRAE